MFRVSVPAELALEGGFCGATGAVRLGVALASSRNLDAVASV